LWNGSEACACTNQISSTLSLKRILHQPYALNIPGFAGVPATATIKTSYKAGMRLKSQNTLAVKRSCSRCCCGTWPAKDR